MTGRYKAYPEYKDSGVEWLGEVPEHWEALPLKRLFKIMNGSTPKSDESSFWNGDIIWVTPADLSKVDTEIFDSSKKITQKGFDSCGTYLVPKGALILSTRAPIGTIAIAGVELCTNQGCKSLVPLKSVNSAFFYYMLLINKNQLNNLGRGSTFLELSTEELSNYIVLLPSIEEKKQIINFLDYETAKIDKLIAKQERLIELLKEKQQTVISHAVTKGLNPNVKMKDSGVEWLGKVPEHWELIPLKYLITLNPKKSSLGRETMSLDCSFVPMDKLKFNNLKLDEIRQIADVYEGYTYFEDDDVLMAKVTPCFENKNIAIAKKLINGIGFGSSEIFVLRPNSKLHNIFLFYRLQEDNFMNIAIAAMSGAGGLKRVPADIISSFVIAYAPIEEQIEISSFLTKKTIKFEKLLDKAESTIELMKERKTALISAAVTGKIDVRG